MSEPNLGQAGRRVCLISSSIRGLLGRCAVVCESVRIHHQTQLRPPEVDAIAVHDLASKGDRESGIDREWNEEPLQLGVGQAEGVAGQCLAEDRNARTAWGSLQHSEETVGIGEAELVGLRDRSLEVALAEGGGEVDQRARRGGDRD